MRLGIFSATDTLSSLFLTIKGDAHMAQKPFQTGAVINLSAGESVKDIIVYTVPTKKRFDVKFLSINGFGHPNQPPLLRHSRDDTIGIGHLSHSTNRYFRNS